MSVQSLAIPEVFLISPKRHTDARGYFVETWNRRKFAAEVTNVDFVQDNESYSRRAGTVRGLHFQKAPAQQAKLVRVLKGRIFDVAVDLRQKSPTFGKWVAVELTAELGEQIFVPHGFAHGFCTLEDDTIVNYKVDSFYDPQSEGGLAWDDPDLAIAWPPIANNSYLSDADRKWPKFSGFVSPFS